jgi:hypothetical protein
MVSRKSSIPTSLGITAQQRAAFARMLSDPCNAPLVPGIFGGIQGNLIRVKSRVAFDSAFSTTTAGYMVWFPDYQNITQAGGTGSNFNMIQWGDSTGNVQPTLLNFGNVTPATTTTAHSFTDPANQFVSSSTCADARTVAACIKVVYTGTTSNQSGAIYPLMNLGITDFIGGNGTPPTIN